MSRPTRVAVVGGGASGEHEVSLASAREVAAGLDRETYDVVELTIDRDGGWWCLGGPVTPHVAVRHIQAADVLFPAVHGSPGEDGALAGFAELLGVPYVGSGVRAGALAMDKAATKRTVAAAGLRTAGGFALSRGSAAPPAWSGPVVVKPVSTGSSLGVARVDEPGALTAALEAAWELDQHVLVEPVVTGREVDVAVLRRGDGSLLVPEPLEIVTEGIFDFPTKYGGAADFRVPAELDALERLELEDAAVTAYEALGCAGLARVDFFLTDEGPVLNEVNTMPGLTRHSQAPRMFAASGLSYAELLALLIDAALHRG